MSTLPPCPYCKSAYTYEDGTMPMNCQVTVA